MKCTIPEISWHNRDPVLSVDIQPKPLEGDTKIRLASGGYDTHVLIWHISENEDGLPHLELASDLTRHLKPVSVVRWSPSGQYLASGDDDSAIFIWKLKGENEPNLFDDSSEQNKETWNVFKTLRGHLDDILDLSWSLDSMYLASGEVGCTAIVWDVMKGKSKMHLNDHKNFVQGVAWDPKEKYLATLSADRTLRIFDAKTGKVNRRINNAKYPVEQSSQLFNKKIRLFHDDTLPTFYRRLCYTPDGNLLIVPSGCSDVVTSSNETAAQKDNKEGKAEKQDKVENKGEETMMLTENTENAENSGNSANAANTAKYDTLSKLEKADKSDKPNKLLNTTYIFTRFSKEPVVVIPSADHFTIAVRCCPTIFKLRPHTENCPPMIDLPYRMVYAVASKSSVYLYDTQQKMPFGSISKIHYSRLTDITWSNDGKMLIASSFDGFCTLISFENGELGEVYDQPINLIDTDQKETQGKKKRRSNEGKNNTPSKDQRTDAPATPATPATEPSKKLDSTNLKQESAQMIAKPKIEIPQTIIASAETFESPEYKEKQATPIAIRRAPRPNSSTPSTGNTTPKSSEPESGSSAKKPKLIATRRQPRNILPSPVVVQKTQADQDEALALDAWPIPIDSLKIEEKGATQSSGVTKHINNDPIVIDDDESEDMHLVYEGESELTLIKTEINSEVKSASKPSNVAADAQKQDTSNNEQCGTPDQKNSKTPRRVQLRTISTPKSKKKLLN